MKALPMSIGKKFVDSVIREVGRNTGKVVSNKIYGNSHSTPIRLVQEMEQGTSPLYSGERRKYRHDLDRIVNGDLPSTKGKAKKQLVSLEAALESCIQEKGKGVENHLAWLQATDDYIDKVQKIVADQDVKLLADEARDMVADWRGAIADAVDGLEYPEEPKESSKKKTNFLLFVGLGLVLGISSFVIYQLETSKENLIPDGYGWYMTGAFAFGILFLSMSSKNKAKYKKELRHYKSAVNAIDEAKSLIKEIR